MTIPKIKSKKIINFINSIWLFPAIMTLLLIVLSALQINGSSMGVYYQMLYGKQTDPALMYGQPQSIRSDEWIVGTQKLIGQDNNGYKPINNNVGNAEDETIMIDVPTRDWSTIFKPHDLAFLILPFDNAYAFRWWVMSYFLVVSCYFFILTLIPKKRLLASLLSLAFLFSPFFQWWYLYGTLASVYYCLFGAAVFAKLLHSKKQLHTYLWSLATIYLSVCFIMVLYPPFQIPCALVLAVFALGYYLDSRKYIDKTVLRRNIIYFFCAILISISIIGVYVYQKYDIIETIQNTAYPGQRVIKSGGYNIEHLLSSNLSPLFQKITTANGYARVDIGATNQSESSNFILIMPFLLTPMLYLWYKNYKQNKKINYIVLTMSTLLAILLAWLFVPGIDFIGKITLLDKVPHPRLLIGIGFINLVLIAGFIKLYNNQKEYFSFAISAIYSLLIVIFYLIVDFHVMQKFPTFVDFNNAVILALPIALIIFLMMRKYFTLAIIGLLLFSVFSTFHINPIYQGTSVLTKTPISQAIKEIGKSSNKRWVSEDIILENFATMNGVRSLSGVYIYPQLELWRDFGDNQKDIYNRYAHVNFNFDRDINNYTPPSIALVGPDQFRVKIKPCDQILNSKDVGFLITSNPFSEGEAPCAVLVKSITYPTATFNIYRLDF